MKQNESADAPSESAEESGDSRGPVLHNFGRNLVLRPRVVETPATEQDVLDALKRHAGRRIRAVGRLHSWSEVPVGDDVILDLRQLNDVRTEQRNGEVWATIGAGCQIKRVVAELERQAGTTLPSLGLINEQALAGAMATGTHGSGRHSLSHYGREFRIARWDVQTGAPVISTITDGPELLAARCSLGCLGVVLSISLPVRSCYRIEEHFRHYRKLEDVLGQEKDFPLQQFFLMPWSWTYFAQHRREVPAPRSALAWLYQLYFLLTFDFGLHLVLLFLVRWCSSVRLLKFFYRRLLPWTVIRGWKVVDESDHLLVMEHERFVHIEIEIFVRRLQLHDAISFLTWLIRYGSGEIDRNPESDWSRRLPGEISLAQLETLRGAYTHHYPVCIRRVCPDETLISMASGGQEDWFAISLISLARPSERDSFQNFARVLAKSAAALFGARPHWGKYHPLDSREIGTLYEGLPEFVRVCSQADPHGRFRNEWLDLIVFDGRR